jgi:hypothetical protein
MSGVLIRSGRDAGPKLPALPVAVPIVPNARRAFAADENVTAFVRLYQGQGALTSAELATRIVNTSDVVVLSQVDAVDAHRFNVAARAVDHHFQLPLGTLEPGDYLLSFIATAGKHTTRRDVRFQLR